MLVRSARQVSVTHSVPFEKRWGGWYVTGQHGSLHHLGNTDLNHLYDEPSPRGTSIQGSTTFAERFSALGPRDHKGRSLRQLDLTRRLPRYPCSYMIYSPQFEPLPTIAKTAIYNRLSNTFAHAAH